MRVPMAVRGVLGVLLVVSAAVGAAAYGSNAFAVDPTVTALMPQSSGPIQAASAVQFRGVVVGQVTGVEVGRLTLTMRGDQIGRIPANVQVRLLPRTLFGDQYVDLALPNGSPRGDQLRPGSVLPADTSAQTVQLYEAYTKLYDLLTALQPAKLQVALTTLADVLRGRGTQIGKMIDNADAVVKQAAPAINTLGDNLSSLAGITKQLAASAPDLIATLDDAVAESHTVVDKQSSIAALLGAGSALATQGQKALLDNADRVVELVHASGPIVSTFANHTQFPKAAVDSLNAFVEAGNRTFSTGRFKIRAALTLDSPYPYTAADCPRYPGMAGPNCGAPVPGGTTGPVGSPQEKTTLKQLLPSSAPQLETANQDIVSLLLGPLVRGAQVLVP